MALILVSGLEMTVSRCEIIISRFAITISHPEINFTTPSGINPHTATRIPHNSATNPRTASRLGVITPMPLPLPHGYGNGCQLVIATAYAADDTHWQCHALRGRRKNGGGGNKIGHKYNKSGTDCVNNVYYII